MTSRCVADQMNHLHLRNRRVMRVPNLPTKKLKLREFGTELSSVNNAQIIENANNMQLRKRKFNQTSAKLEERPLKRTRYNLRSRKIIDQENDLENRDNGESTDEDIDIAAIKNSISKNNQKKLIMKPLRRSLRLRKKNKGEMLSLSKSGIKEEDMSECDFKENSVMMNMNERAILKIIRAPAMSDFDVKILHSELYSGDYIADIVSYYRDVEGFAVSSIRNNYFTHASQSDLHEKMRYILLDWMFNVCRKFKLCDRTLFFSVYALDMYLSKQAKIDKKRLQLIACCCIWIASKYHEIYAPEAGDFVFISDNSFKLSDLLSCEQDVLCTLQFNFMDLITPLHFTERFVQICQWPLHEKYSLRGTDAAMKSCEQQCTLVDKMAQYFTQLALLDCHLVSCYKPSKISAACLCFSVLSISLYKQWPDYLKKETGYSIEDLRDILKLLNKVRKTSNAKFNSIRKKFKCLQQWFDRLNINAVLNA